MDNGRLVIPYIDKRLRNLKYDDINKCNDIKISNITIDNTMLFNLKYHDKEYDINFSIPNKAYISNILIAFEIATYFMIDIDSIINSINNYRNMKSRMDIIKKSKYTVINDTYNSSYESIKGVLNYLKQLDTNKLVILGDIKELGKYGIKIHKKINKLLKGIYKENILLVGELTKYIKGIHFNDNEDIIDYLKKFNLNNYTILVKGSRAMHMEDIVDFLKK
jgi:UDP-N-acetylmuramoyl-tripeptide--D-alanyl-D-alanine ligase